MLSLLWTRKNVLILVPNSAFKTKALFKNIQGISNEITILERFLVNTPNLDIICTTKHWMSDYETGLSAPNGFTCASACSKKYCITKEEVL